MTLMTLLLGLSPRDTVFSGFPYFSHQSSSFSHLHCCCLTPFYRNRCHFTANITTDSDLDTLCIGLENFICSLTFDSLGYYLSYFQHADLFSSFMIITNPMFLCMSNSLIKGVVSVECNQKAILFFSISLWLLCTDALEPKESRWSSRKVQTQKKQNTSVSTPAPII